MSRSLYIQYGCGLCAPADWLNFDASPTLRLQRLPLIGALAGRWVKPEFPSNVQYGDAVKGLPVPREACAGVYCSHVLEHLALMDCRTAIRNTFTYLRKGGTFRLVLPDLHLLASEYMTSQEPGAGEAFVKNTLLGHETRPRGVGGLLRQFFGNSRHLWMWDYKALEKELLAAGFCEIRPAKCGDSDEPMFRHVEEPARWERALGMQCAK